MGRSFLICRIGGVPIRVHWAFLLLPIYFLYGPAIARDSAWLLLSLAALASLVIAVICHELAHATSGRALGAHVHEIVLWPLGGFTRLSDMPPTPRAQILLSLSGPVCNLALAGVSYALWRALGVQAWYVHVFASWNLLLGLFNLVPAPPLDGGEALRAALRAGLGRARGDLWAGRVGLGAAAGVILLGIAWHSVLVVIIGMMCGAFSWNLLRANRFTGYAPRPRVPRSGDFRVWRLPKQELDGEIKRKHKAKRSSREMRQKVDELLKQISEKGMDSLSEQDRALLRRASKQIRRRGG